MFAQGSVKRILGLGARTHSINIFWQLVALNPRVLSQSNGW